MSNGSKQIGSGKNKKVNTFPTPQYAVFLDDLVKAETQSELEGAKFLVQTDEGFRSVDANVFLEQFSPLIGTYSICASNDYDQFQMVPCVGGELYSDNFVRGLAGYKQLVKRLPRNWITYQDGVPVVIKLPDYRDCVPQFDPSLPYGTVQREGIEDQFIDQFDDYSEIPFLDKNAPLSINAGNYVLQHKTIVEPENKPTISALQGNVYTLDILQDYSNNLDSTNYRKISIVKANYNYYGWKKKKQGSSGKDYTKLYVLGTYPEDSSKTNTFVACTYSFGDIFSDGDGTSMTSGGHYLLALSKAANNKKVPIKTYSASNIDLPTRRIAEFRGVNKGRITCASKTREQTFNGIVCLITGALKKNGDLKRHWLIDIHGNNYADDNDQHSGLFLIKSDSERGDYIGQNLEIMQDTQPDAMAQYFTRKQFDHDFIQYKDASMTDSGDDCIGFIANIESSLRNKGLVLKDYFHENYTKLQCGDDGVDLRLQYGVSNINNEFVIMSRRTAHTMTLKPIYKFSTETKGELPTRFSVQAECNTMTIRNTYRNDAGSLIAQSPEDIQCPTITIEWWVVGKIVRLQLVYKFNGIKNKTLWLAEKSYELQANVMETNSSSGMWKKFYRPIDSMFWRVCLGMERNDSSDKIKAIKGMANAFPVNGIINSSLTDIENKNYFFYMKFKDSLINTDYENMLNSQQSKLAKDFMESVLADNTDNDSKFDAIGLDKTTDISTYLDTNQYFLLGGKKVKFHYDMVKERFIGFKAVVEQGDNDKGHALCFSHFSDAEKISEFHLDFWKEGVDSQRKKVIYSQVKNVKAIKLPYNSSGKLSILYKDENNDVQWDNVVGNTTADESIYIFMSGKVMLVCLPGYDVKKIKETIDAWPNDVAGKPGAGKNISKDIAIAIVNEHPFFLTNTDNNDMLKRYERTQKEKDDGTGTDRNIKFSKGLVGYPNPKWMLFYFKMN